MRKAHLRRGEQTYRTKMAAVGAEVVGEYKGAATPVPAKCRSGHDWNPRPDAVGGCRVCATKKSEKAFGVLLGKLGIGEPKPQAKLPDGPCKKCPFDFGTPGILWEYDGQPHFEPLDWFGGEAPFPSRRQRDVDKTREALKAGYRLIRADWLWMTQSEEKKLTWLRAALASPARFVVTNPDLYFWLADSGTQPVGVEPSAPPAPRKFQWAKRTRARKAAAAAEN